MCGGGPPKPKPPPKPVQPPVQPPPLVEASPEVAIGNQSQSESKRRKVGRSSLRQSPSTSGGAASSGLGQ